MFIYQTLSFTVQIVSPVSNWKHIDGCNLDKYVSNESVGTNHTKLVGMHDERSDYTLYINQADGYNFAIELDIDTKHLSYTMYAGGNSLPIENGGWDYEFRGETLVIELFNKDIIFLYIPWEGGSPDEYSYFIGESLADGGCFPQ